jgi:hypothetical protein
MENLALLFFKSDTRTIETAYTLTTVPIDIGFAQAMIALPKLVAFGARWWPPCVLILIVGPHRPGPRDPRRGEGEARAPSSWASTWTMSTP